MLICHEPEFYQDIVGRGLGLLEVDDEDSLIRGRQNDMRGETK